MDVRIRQAIPQDYEALLPLFEDVDALHRQHHPERFQKPAGPARERDFFLTALADEQVGFFVAEVSGELVGHIRRGRARDAACSDPQAAPFCVY